MNHELEPVLRAARTLPPAELPRLLGDLEEVKAVAFSRLSASTLAPVAPDELLSVKQAAVKLGCSTAYLYRNDLPFIVRMGRKRMFSRAGLEAYLAKSR
jgi:excisionase family DNA binding protein